MSGQLNVSIVLPFGVTFKTGLLGQEEPPIWVRLTTRDLADAVQEIIAVVGTGHTGNFSRIRQFMNDGAAAQFVIYYENFIGWVKAQASYNIAKFEPTWAFGRVVRNAIGHAGKIAINDKNFASVEWGGIKYGPPENGRMVIGNDLQAPDLVVLMLDMDRALEEMGYSPPA